MLATLGSLQAASLAEEAGGGPRVLLGRVLYTGLKGLSVLGFRV